MKTYVSTSHNLDEFIQLKKQYQEGGNGEFNMDDYNNLLKMRVEDAKQMLNSEVKGVIVAFVVVGEKTSVSYVGKNLADMLAFLEGQKQQYCFYFGTDTHDAIGKSVCFGKEVAYVFRVCSARKAAQLIEMGEVEAISLVGTKTLLHLVKSRFN